MKPWLVLGLALTLAFPLSGCLDDGDGADAQSSVDGLSTSGTPTKSVRGSGTAGNQTASGNATAGNGTASGNATVGGNATGNGTVGGNATGNATGNQVGGNATHWEYDNRTGTVAGTAVPVLSASVKKTEAIDVGNGTLNLTLNLTSTGDDITVEVTPPGCEEDDCTTTVESEGGRADLAFDDPAEGEWSVTLSVSGIGSVEADYELTVATLVPGNATA